MSHVVEAPVRITDLTALSLAAAELGGKLVEGVTSYVWYGRWVGDSPMPQGMTKDDLGKCDHVIRFPGIQYEVGVRKQVDGSYSLTYDWWHSGGLKNKLGTEAGPLAQSYAKHKTLREVQRLGGRYVSSTKLEDGTLRLQVQGGGSW